MLKKSFGRSRKRYMYLHYGHASFTVGCLLSAWICMCCFAQVYLCTGTQGTSWLCLCAVCGRLWCFRSSISYEWANFCWTGDKCSCCFRIKKTPRGNASEDQAKVAILYKPCFLLYECVIVLIWLLFYFVALCAEVVVLDMEDEDPLHTVSFVLCLFLMTFILLDFNLFHNSFFLCMIAFRLLLAFFS